MAENMRDIPELKPLVDAASGEEEALSAARQADPGHGDVQAGVARARRAVALATALCAAGLAASAVAPTLGRPSAWQQAGVEGVVGLSAADPPMTTCKTIEGDACVFPFKYRDARYGECTSLDHGKPWCYIEVDDSRNGVEGQWGECAPSCFLPETGCASAFDDLEGEIVDTVQLEVKPSMAVSLIDDACCLHCSKHGACQFWVRSDETCWLMKDPVGTPRSASGRRGGWRSSNKHECATDDDEHVCVFPFMYQGLKHWQCTAVDHTQPWCATRVGDNGGMVEGQWANCGPSCKDAADGNGVVDELYTFGAPAVATHSLEDRAHQDGCFPGMRAYTEDRATGAWQSRHDVDFAPLSNYFQHAKQGTLVLHWFEDSWMFSCDHASVGWPTKGWNVMPSAGLHLPGVYNDRLAWTVQHGLDEAPAVGAKLHMNFASEVYNGAAQVPKGWRRLVHDHVNGWWGDRDFLLLAQHEETLDCALAFSGTETTHEVLSSAKLFALTSSSTFCGLSGIHAGFAEELWHLSQSWPWRASIRPKLPRCKRVVVSGHSMGGAIAELFAACVNSGNVHDDIFQGLSWAKEVPAPLWE